MAVGLGHEGKGGRLTSEPSACDPCSSVVCALQHALAESLVPVVLRSVFLKVFSGHVLCGALLELDFPKAPLLSCALGDEEREKESINNFQ